MTARKASSNKDMAGLKVINLGAPSGTSNDAVRKIDLETAETDARSRANHTGTQLAATISDFHTAVRINRLDQLSAPTGSVGYASQKIINLLDPQAGQDAATKNYVDTQLGAVASGQTLKGTVRAVELDPISVTSAPATVGGISPNPGDVFLLAGQSTGTENGPRVWTAAGLPMDRTDNWNVAGEAVVGSYWIVREGNHADRFALLNNDAFTLDSSTAAFTFVAMVPDISIAVEQDCGNGALTSFPIAHPFNTRAVGVTVWRNASPYDEIDVAVERTNLGTVTLQPDAVWATNEYHAVVSKL